MRVVQQIAGRTLARKLTEQLTAAIKATGFPEDAYQTTKIIYQSDALFGTGGVVSGRAESSKKEFPWSSVVLDEEGTVGGAWHLEKNTAAARAEPRRRPLPPLGAGRALHRAADLVGDPATVERPRLGPNPLTVDETTVDAPGIERHPARERLERGLRVGVGPGCLAGTALTGHHVEIAGPALPLAETGPAGGFEKLSLTSPGGM